MKKILFASMLTFVMVTAGSALAIMGGPGMMGPGMGLTNAGGFGMTNGMTGAPVVGDDGTAYLVSHIPAPAAGAVPNSGSFQSTIMAVSPSGQINSITLNGIVSRPVLAGGMLVSTASLPNFANYNVVNPAGTQSVVYGIPLPLTSSSVPLAVALDGQFTSMPVIENNYIYVTTTDFGGAMMSGNRTFDMMYGNYNFNSTGQAKSYLYILNLDGTVVSKTELQ
jgi:hypothetical protein